MMLPMYALSEERSLYIRGGKGRDPYISFGGWVSKETVSRGG
jgi:hypothetical protein